MHAYIQDYSVIIIIIIVRLEKSLFQMTDIRPCVGTLCRGLTSE